MRVSGSCTLFVILIHASLQSTQNEDTATEVAKRGAGEDYKPRRWSQSGGHGPYRMVVSARDRSPDHGGLEPNESVAYIVAVQDSASKKTLNNKSDSLDKATGIPIWDDFGEKYDKVTQRVAVKRGRKRERLVVDNGGRKRRRNPVVSTTGLPQTLSYNIYNHFRPVEQGVPHEAIIPFLDFGRKLPTGPTPSAINSIEGSSTPRSNPSSPSPLVKEDIFHDDMDVSVTRKAVERNSAPREKLLLRVPEISGFFKATDKNSTEILPQPVHPVVKIIERRANLTKIASESNKTSSTQLLELSTNTKLNDTILTNKTEKIEGNSDLMHNESGVKYHAVISPEKPAELKRATLDLKVNSTSNKTLTVDHVDSETPTEIENTTEKHQVPTKLQHSGVKETTENKTREADKVITALIPANTPQTNITSSSSEEPTTFDYPMTPLPLQQTTTVSPSPTPRILSTAVVTSVSVKESPRNPRLKSNYTVTAKANSTTPLNLTFHSPSVLFYENRTAFSNLQSIMRRKLYTTVRPKSTFKPVTFRSTFRRNFTKKEPAVVRVVSTPPSYIEVPKILTRVRPRVGLISLHSEGIKSAHAGPVQSSKNSHLERTTEKTSDDREDDSLQSANDSTTDSTAATMQETTSVKVTQKRQPSTVTVQPTQTTEHSLSSEPPETSTYTESAKTDTTEAVFEAESKNDTSVVEVKPIGTYIPPQSVSTTKEETPAETKELPPGTYETSTEATLHRGILKTDQGLGIKQIPPWNLSTGRPGSSTIGPVYPDSLSVASYILAALAIVPLVLGIFVLVRQVLQKSKKKVLDESEYSSEYNRSPLPTKLPRLPAHIASEPRQITLNWEDEKTNSPPPIPVTKWEFSREKLRLQTVLGQGNFGQVWKAEADDISGHEGLTRLVAVKTVKEGSSQREKEDLLRELGIMQELGSHPNVVTLLGCCTEKEPYLLIMEYVMYGKLLAFLREHRTRAHYFNFSDLSSALTSRDLTVFSYCVARGMEFLVSKGIIHRDLAARNILVDHNKLCKIADFGMSRNVRDTGQIYEQRASRGALPIRWMAPESLHYSLFTQKSDVWSFGILLWEIITLGSTPYNTMSGREVMRQVKDGYRLEKPKHCKSEFYRVLTKCWHSDPTKRPSFSDLKQEIGALLGDKDSEGGYVDLEALAEEMSESSN